MASDPREYLGDGLGSAKKPHACVLVIFGASGDLTKRKLIPALYNLALEKRLPDRFAVVGYARTDMTDESFRDKMREANPKLLATFNYNSWPFGDKDWETAVPLWSTKSRGISSRMVITSSLAS